jgi:hypothetical protein
MDPEYATDVTSAAWTVSFKNSRVRKGWLDLFDKAAENMQRCEEHLKTKPMERSAGRIFPLKGKPYKGAWEYEVTASDRVFYVPDPIEKTVLVYYAGKHVSPAPVL